MFNGSDEAYKHNNIDISWQEKQGDKNVLRPC